MEEMITQIKEILKKCTLPNNLDYTIDWTDVFLGNTNDQQAFERVKNAATSLSIPIEERAYPLKWGEDFGYFTQRFPGAFFGIGAGENCPALHNPDYDFPDELIETGISIFDQLIHEFGLYSQKN